MTVEVTYRMPSQGLGTDFSQFDRPINFASVYTNRFRNITGGAERRPGMLTYAAVSVPGNPNLTRIHEFVDQYGNETLMTSDDLGNLWAAGTNLSQYQNIQIPTDGPLMYGSIDALLNVRPQSAQGSGMRPILSGGTATNTTSFWVGGYAEPGATCYFKVENIDISGTTSVILTTAVSSTFAASNPQDQSWALDPTGRYIAMYIQDTASPTHRFVIFDTSTNSFGPITSVNMGSSSATKQIGWLDNNHLIVDHVLAARRGVELLSVSGTTITDIGFTDVWGASSSATRIPLSYCQYSPNSSGGLFNYMTNSTGGSFNTLYGVTLVWDGVSAITVGTPYIISNTLTPGTGSGAHANMVFTTSTELTLCYAVVDDFYLMSFTPGPASASISRVWQHFSPSFGTGTTTQIVYMQEDNILVIVQRSAFESVYRMSDMALNLNSFSLSVDAVQVLGDLALESYFMITRISRTNIMLAGTGGFTFDLGQVGIINRAPNSTWLSVIVGKAAVRMISAEADNKLIFVNGVNRNFYTDDAGATFEELKALITQGTMASGTSANAVTDGNISNWIGATLVSNNDIVYNITQGAYGLVTTVASASLGTTTIGTSGLGAGNAGSDQAPGDIYQLIDYVDMNIIPDGAGSNDNVGTAGTGTDIGIIAVSGVDFSTTEIREDDFIYNSTRGAIAHVGAVSANVNIKENITGQVPGDALVFFKSAMPIASWVHVHYGRVYYLDSRNNQRIVISAPDDPQDVTTYQKTLDSTSFSFGTQQPTGDALLSMNTFLSYFVASGKRNLYIYQGNDPIQDTSQTALNFTPIAFYPNGLAGRFGLATNGGDLLHITVDGLQAISIGYNAFSLNQNNASVPILNTLRNAITSQTNTDNIQLTYYPRRRWLINKIGDQCFILNTQPAYDATGQQQTTPAWHLYSGLWSQQNHYFVRRNGDLLACGPGGNVYFMDSSGSTDNGATITTDLQTAWLRLEEPQLTRRVKEGFFIEPVFESDPSLEYTISVRAGFDNYSSDSITVSAGGTGAIGSFIVGETAIGAGMFAQANKYPLRWRGEEFRLEFTSNSSAAPDIITGYTVIGNITGRR